MSRDRLLAVVAGIVGALAFAAALSGNPLGILLGYASLLPLLAAGLAFGPTGLSLAGTAGIVAVTLAGGIVSAGVYLLVDVLPAALLIGPALGRIQQGAAFEDWPGPGRVIATLSVGGAIVLVAAGLLLPTEDAGLEGMVRQGLETVVASLGPQQEALSGTAVSTWAPILPSVMLASWVVRAAILGILAQALVVRAGRAWRPTPRYSRIALPTWVVLAPALALGLGFVIGGDAGYVARNMALVLAMPLFFQGLSVAHHVAGRTKAPGLVLAAFYGVFLISSFWAVPAVVGLGFVEHWIRLRRQEAGANSREED